MNKDKRRIEFAAQVTNAFRGVPVIICGFLFCIFALVSYATELDTQSRNGDGRNLTNLSIFLLFVVIYFVLVNPRISGYYRQKYGRTNEKPGKNTFLERSLVVIPFVIGYFFGGRIDSQHQFGFSVTVLFSALFALAVWWFYYRGISKLVLYLSITLLFAAFLPWEQIFRSVTNTQNYDARREFYQNLIFLVYGFTIIASGLTEYLFMIKTLKPVEREEEVYESV